MRALDLVGVEDFVASAARHDGSQLPGEIGHIFHAAIHALAGKWRHQMRRIAGEENATVSPFIGDARMERVNHAPFDLDRGKINERRKQPPDAVVTDELVGLLPGQLHELPTDARSDRRQSHGGPARVAKERDVVDTVIVDPAVDDEPALGVGRTDKARTNPTTRAAVSAIAADKELGAQRLPARRRFDLDVDAMLVLRD